MDMVSLKGIGRSSKIALLKELGYGTDGTLVLKDGAPVVDPYVDERVTLDNMLILPGSTVIITDNEVSIVAYFEEHGDWE
jgi:hypothetical protein